MNLRKTRGSQSQVTLVVAEKPSVARDLARVLGAPSRAGACWAGPGLWITWCIGHVAELAEPEAYSQGWRAWRLTQLPMVPRHFKLRAADHTRDHWPHLRGLLLHPQVKDIVNACDAGREGELIFRFAMELAGADRPVRRMWLTAMTDTAIHHAYARLRPAKEFNDLADAARCRAEADWLVGLNATRALTLSVRQKERSRELLTVGRVQTPTLAMLVAREEAIETFVPIPYHLVEATMEVAGDKLVARFSADTPAADSDGTATMPKRARPKSPKQAAPSRHPERLPNEQAAQVIVEQALRAATARVERVDEQVETERPPLLYDLTGLQRRANARFGLSAATTLEAAQTLYERHKALTYPRTDSQYLPSALQQGLPRLVHRLGAGLLGDAASLAHDRLSQQKVCFKRIIDDGRVTDHHAIVPTGKLVATSAMSPNEQRIYELVLRRFLAVFHENAQLARTKLSLRLGPHLFIARGRTTIKAGWHAIDPPAPAGPMQGALLPHVTEGDSLAIDQVRALKRQTEPPPRLTEATLLARMEGAGASLQAQQRVGATQRAAGLGTPATRAAIIETLKRRGFAVPDGRSLRPTQAGRRLIAALTAETLKSAALTGRWEARLLAVAEGKLSRKAFMAEVHALVASTVDTIVKSSSAAP